MSFFFFLRKNFTLIAFRWALGLGAAAAACFLMYNDMLFAHVVILLPITNIPMLLFVDRQYINASDQRSR